MSINAIPRRYAKALVGLAEDPQRLEQFGRELDMVEKIFSDHRQLRNMLISPTYSLAKKKGLLGDFLGLLDLSEEGKHFFGLLLEKDRLKFLTQITVCYHRLADEKAGIERAYVTSARKLSKDLREQIKAVLEQQTGKKVDLEVKVDNTLIGGIRTEIGGKVVDGSILTQLKRMEDTLTKG
ncbi:MAG: ATP synthase F1 subunit delta [Desulfuromonadaceae bacterium]|nr:ATP synthase F1 subunit delta [Desulfuromonadaceae bacterium]